VLYGNSSWIDLDALSKQSTVTEGMFIAAPLLPEATQQDTLLQLYQRAVGDTASAWELLGLDAAEFVGKIMARKPRDRASLREDILRSAPYSGRAVTVDFKGTHENKSARVLKYENGELEPVR
jgi:hypothetical protein